MNLISAVRAAGLAVVMLLGAGDPARAGDEVQRGPTPAWVVDTPASGPATSSTDDGLRILSFDAQFRVEDDRQSAYVRSRSVASSPQGLAVLGAIGMAWDPALQDVIVHRVDIVRDGEVIDVLASQDFETIRREENLEHAMLDGQLTALLQPSGLRVGDVLDFAYTVVSKFPVAGGRAEQAVDLNLPIMVDRMRYRASWPTAAPVRLRAANEWTDLPVRRDGAYSSVEVVRENAQPQVPPPDLPARLQRVNLIEISGYRDWSEVAAVMSPLYDRARTLAPDSPLHAEVARIRALSDDPAVQAAAALRLVQDQMRYVALLMGQGGLTPASADETWSRRFGDCKAKTALLLALLDGLGIEADPAAVSLTMGDGLDQRLPGVGAFNHVLVRAVVGGRVHWLDGTLTGDRTLEQISTPPFHWALPLVATGARLEALALAPRSEPDGETVLAFDASGGRFAPVAVTGTTVMRGQAAAVLAGQIGLVPAAQKEQGLRGIWEGIVGEGVVSEVGSAYDADAAVLTLSMTGTTTFDWPDSGLILPGSSYVPLTAPERPQGPFRDAPYALDHPSFSRQVATLKLPNGGHGFRVEGGAFDRTEFGHQLSREVKLDGELVTIEVTIRSLAGEITAAQAETDRKAASDRRLDRPRILAGNTALTEADRAALAADTPETGGDWLDRALALSRAGDAQGALAAAEKAVELSPENSSSWANRGVYRFWTGDREGAASDLEKAVELDPSERTAMNGHALLARAEGRHQDVVIEMTRALRQAPTDDFALGMRAEAYGKLGQHDRALRDADALIAAHPAPQAKLRRIGVLHAAGRTEEAGTELDALVAAHPGDRTVLLSQARFELDRGAPQKALDIVDAWMNVWTEPEAEPEPEPVAPGETPLVMVDPQALFLSAEAALAAGRLDRAAADLDELRDIHADDAGGLNNLCWLAARAGALLEQALKDCDAALALAPNAAAFLDSKGRVLLQMGQASAALQAYDAALAKTPELAPSLYGRGLARIALGDVEEGEADKAAALALDADAAGDFKAYVADGPAPSP